MKRKIAHFKVSSALRPQQAVEVSLDRARQQLDIYQLLKKLTETAKNIPAVKQEKFATYLRDERDIPVILKAQVLDGVSPVEYVDEGL